MTRDGAPDLAGLSSYGEYDSTTIRGTTASIVRAVAMVFLGARF